MDPEQHWRPAVKIVINAASAKMGGAVTYLINVLHNLPMRGSDDEVVVFAPPETAGRLAEPPGNVRLVPTNIGSAKWWQRFWWEQITLRSCLRKLRADALFSTANFGMFRCPVRQILLVRNNLYFSASYFNNFLPRHSLRFQLSFRLRRWLCCLSVRAADTVMTPSQAMMDDLRQFAEIEPWKEFVNQYGVVQPAQFCNEESAKRRLSEPSPEEEFRLLYVSLYAEHKNLGTLLKALPILNREGDKRFVLVTTVNPKMPGTDWMVTRPDDITLTEQPNIAPWVQIVGPLTLDETNQLYLDSDIFMFPAITESFGHPMVEAMAHGLPIVAADTHVNREVCCDAALYFEPLDPVDLARQVTRLAEDRRLREDLTARARRQASRFQWATHAQRVVDALQGKPVEPARLEGSRPKPPSDSLPKREAQLREREARTLPLRVGAPSKLWDL
jgi:glycosyltransferase involved in cell wall biosynthesis